MYSENSISKKLRTFAENNEWIIKGSYIYGDEQGVLFSGLDGKGVKTFITPVPRITEEEQTELFDVLEKNKSTMKLAEYVITDDFLCIRIKDSLQLKTEDIEFIIALLVGTLQELNIMTVGRCQECGKMEAGSEHFVFDLYCYMHADCAKAYDEEMGLTAPADSIAADMEDAKIAFAAADEQQVSADSKLSTKIRGQALADREIRTVRKVLFTILGTVIGALPWLALPYIMDFVNGLVAKLTTNEIVINFVLSLVTCLCAYLIPYAAVLGYRLSKAKMDTKGRWIVGIVAITTVILIQLASVAILIIKEPSVTLTFDNYVLNLTKSAIYINLLLGLLIGTVFTLISVLPFFDTSLSSKNAKKTKVSKTGSTDESVDDASETALEESTDLEEKSDEVTNEADEEKSE